MAVQDGPKICGTRGCSSFGRPLRKERDQSGIELDVCDGCGCTVLDPGELQQITQYAAAVAKSLARSQPVPSYSSWNNSQPARPTVVNNNYGSGGYNSYNSGGVFGGLFGDREEVYVEPDGDVVVVERDMFGRVEDVDVYDNDRW